MIEFIRILLFSKMILLTPEPIDLNKGGMVNIDRPVSAITAGAAIYIDVSSMVPNNAKNIIEVREWVNSHFHEGFAIAILSNGSDGEKLTLQYTGGFSWSGQDLKLVLSSEGGVPIDKKYERIKLETKVELRQVLIYWKNYKS